MRISEYHSNLREQGRVPAEKVGRNKGVRRAWRADRRADNALAEAERNKHAQQWEKEIQEIDKNTEKLLSLIFITPEDING